MTLSQLAQVLAKLTHLRKPPVEGVYYKNPEIGYVPGNRYSFKRGGSIHSKTCATSVQCTVEILPFTLCTPPPTFNAITLTVIPVIHSR